MDYTDPGWMYRPLTPDMDMSRHGSGNWKHNWVPQNRQSALSHGHGYLPHSFGGPGKQSPAQAAASAKGGRKAHHSEKSIKPADRDKNPVERKISHVLPGHSPVVVRTGLAVHIPGQNLNGTVMKHLPNGRVQVKLAGGRVSVFNVVHLRAR